MIIAMNEWILKKLINLFYEWEGNEENEGETGGTHMNYLYFCVWFVDHNMSVGQDQTIFFYDETRTIAGRYGSTWKHVETTLD